MAYREEDYLPLSGLQHFYFCKRQWALIHVEGLWLENGATAEGRLVHERADDPFFTESRVGTVVSRSVPVASSRLGLSGVMDVLELTKGGAVALPGRPGLWGLNGVEYKRGRPKTDDRDKVQLAAEMMCLEEMLGCTLEKSDLYYHTTRRRLTVRLTEELREEVFRTAREMHRLFEGGITPPAETGKHCTRCSLYEGCMPALTRRKASVQNYMDRAVKDDA